MSSSECCRRHRQQLRIVSLLFLVLVGSSCLVSGAPVTDNNDSSNRGVDGAGEMLERREADDPCASRRWWGCKLAGEGENKKVDKEGKAIILNRISILIKLRYPAVGMQMYVSNKIIFIDQKL